MFFDPNNNSKKGETKRENRRRERGKNKEKVDKQMGHSRK